MKIIKGIGKVYTKRLYGSHSSDVFDWHGATLNAIGFFEIYNLPAPKEIQEKYVATCFKYDLNIIEYLIPDLDIQKIQNQIDCINLIK